MIGSVAADNCADDTGTSHVGIFLEELDDRGIGENLGVGIAVPETLLVVLMEMGNVNRESDAFHRSQSVSQSDSRESWIVYQ